MSTSSSGGSGRAAASTSSLARSRVTPWETGLCASGSDIAHPHSYCQGTCGYRQDPLTVLLGGRFAFRAVLLDVGDGLFMSRWLDG